MSVSVFKYALERRCNLQWNDIEQISVSNAFDAFDAANACRDQSVRQGLALCERLHSYGSHDNPAVRRAALGLRRDVHNQRARSRESYASLLPELDEATTQALEAWRSTRDNVDTMLTVAGSKFDTSLEASRFAVAKLVLENELFACGVQSANRRIYEQSLEYCEAINFRRKLDKKLRGVEDRLISFIYKVAAKPSPFASFASILVRAAPGAASFGSARRELRLARDLLLWLEAKCIEVAPAIAENLPVRLNNNLKVSDERIELFTRGKDGTPGMRGAERFVELKLSAALALVVQECAGSPTTLKSFERKLIGLGQTPAKAKEYLAALVSVGLLEVDLGIEDQTSAFAARAAQVLAKLPDGCGEPFATLFSRLAQLESEIGAVLSASARQPLLLALGNCLAEFADALGTDPKVLREVRDLYFEDVAVPNLIAATEPLLKDAELDALRRLRPLLMLFDAQLSSRLSVTGLFCELYGADASVNLLDFYKDYRAIPKEQLFARFEPTHPAIATLMRQRNDFCLRVSALLAEGREVDIASSNLASFVDSLTCYFDTRSVSMFVQPLLSNNASFVLNNAGTGFGASMSRFAHLFQNEEGTLGHALASDLASMHGAEHAFDLCAVLAANSNLHSPLLTREIVYPGSRKRQGVKTLSLRDVRVYHRNGELKMKQASNGEPIDLLSLNFIHPAAGPALYRFLHLFSSFWNYRAQDLQQALLLHTAGSVPRLRFGSILLCRALRQFRVSQINSVVSSARTETDALLALESWRRAEQLQRRVFFRATTAGSAPSDLNSLEQVMKLRRGRLRKPHLLDFHNPFLVRIFLKQIAALAPDGIVQLQESLPDIAETNGLPIHELLIQVDNAH
jgi:hypothetical protein